MKMHYYHKISKIIVLCLLVVPTGILLCLIWICVASSGEREVMINEVCSNNFTVARDANDKYSDYVELYNPGEKEVSLEGYYLSDDEEKLQKYSLDTVSIPANGYYVVWLDGEFRIASGGEEVFLSRTQDEKLVDYVNVPALAYNTSYGRVADGEERWESMTATTGRTNAEAKLLPDVQLRAPVFSAESGFYAEGFDLKLTAALGEDIYYTLDGSEPSCDSIPYDGGITITDASQNENIYAARTDLSPTKAYTPDFLVDKATVVRAISYNERNGSISDIATKVYFVGYEQKSEYENFPILSLIADPEDLFDPEIGIYANGVKLEEYKQKGGWKNGELLDAFTDAEGNEHMLYMASNAFNDGKEWEREAVITYFDNDHEYCFSQKVGIQTAGQSTRGTPQKSFSIYGRDIYDDTVTIPYEFFKDMSYSSIKLRNGGNENDTVKIKDAFWRSWQPIEIFRFKGRNRVWYF